jgi:uncharacterized membrane protein YbaN (DUF454 family)
MSENSRTIFRPLWLILGLVSVALGVLGIVLPVLPTTPLMILAAFFFSKSSPRLEAWLLDHRVFGPVIADWRENGAISPKIKTMAVGTMAAVFVLSVIMGVKPFVLIIQAVCLGGAAWFVLSRPSQ